MPPVRTKEWPYLDVVSESANNAVRLLLGWFPLIATEIPPLSLVLSYWMVGAFFMATKRYAEYRHIGNPSVAAAYRRSFKYYTEERLLVSMLFYATTCALFAGIFMVRYHLELILFAPAAAGMFAYYLHIGMLPDSPVQNPEKLYKQKGFFAYMCLCDRPVHRLDVHVDPWAVHHLQRRVHAGASALDDRPGTFPVTEAHMPGLVGIVGGGQSSELTSRFDMMLRRMQRHRPFLTEREQDPAGRWAFGRAHLGNLQRAPQGTTGQVTVWLHGDLWNAGQIVRAEGLPHESSSREVVAYLYTKYGSEFASRLEGAFAVAIFDRQANRLFLATDIVGAYPLYWRKAESEFSFCSDLTALIAGASVKPRLDLRAVADYLTDRIRCGRSHAGRWRPTARSRRNARP